MTLKPFGTPHTAGLTAYQQCVLDALIEMKTLEKVPKSTLQSKPRSGMGNFTQALAELDARRCIQIFGNIHKKGSPVYIYLNPQLAKKEQNDKNSQMV